MTEWLLLLTVNLVGAPGEIRDLSVQTIPGFVSKATCDAAAENVAHRLIAVIGRAREERGIAGNSRTRMPAIDTECVEIRK
jgi:hypothetical protein